MTTVNFTINTIGDIENIFTKEPQHRRVFENIIRLFPFAVTLTITHEDDNQILYSLKKATPTTVKELRDQALLLLTREMNSIRELDPEFKEEPFTEKDFIDENGSIVEDYEAMYSKHFKAAGLLAEHEVYYSSPFLASCYYAMTTNPKIDQNEFFDMESTLKYRSEHPTADPFEELKMIQKSFVVNNDYKEVLVSFSQEAINIIHNPRPVLFLYSRAVAGVDSDVLGWSRAAALEEDEAMMTRAVM